MLSEISRNSTFCSTSFSSLHNKENIKAPYHYPFVKGTLWWSVNFPHKQRASNMESVPMLWRHHEHYNDVIMGTMASHITSLVNVYLTVYSGSDQRKHESSAQLAFVWGIHRSPVNSPHKWPVTRKVFPFDDVMMMFRKNIRHKPAHMLILFSLL